MLSEKQRTIAQEVKISGVGLHTAHKANIIFKPAKEDTGIVFIRTDLENSPEIKLSPDTLLTLSHGYRRTSVGLEKAQVHTIEHLMAALAGLGIDNLYIEIDNDEIPGIDGSSQEFFYRLKEAGILEQAKARKFFTINEPIFVSEEDASIIALPANEFSISYTLNYNHPLLQAQYFQLSLSSETFEKELVSARTFCLEEEAENLQNKGLGLGASYANTLVVSKEGVKNNTLRFPDEFVRHKILDLVGDLYVLGYPLQAKIIAIKSGHALNLKLVNKIYQYKKRIESGGVKLHYQPEYGEQFDASMVMRILPHRPPFLFVDKVLSLERGKRIRAVKNVTINDYFFEGHFPERPVMPGVLIVEAMAQAGGIMMLSAADNLGKLAFFLAINNVKFRRTVLPGDQLVLEAEVGKLKSKTGLVYARALVEDKLVSEAELMFVLVEE